jgi:murein DD-endopeptidase MepM/ murein hydrolase activator NlpD
MADTAHKVIIAGVGFDIDVEPNKMRNMFDFPYWNATTQNCVPIVPGAAVHCGAGGAPFAPAKGLSGTKTTRYRPRHLKDKSLRAVQQYVRQFVIHLDGCADAAMCWHVLQNERGLSCHFVLDNDGTLYQTLDLADCGYHAAGLNETSIGIEISNRGDARKDPSFYSKKGIKREPVTCTIHGEKYVAFDYTDEQKKTMVALGRTLAKALPGIPLTYPQTVGGEPIWGRLRPAEGLPEETILRQTYSGYLGHYHITRQKWDPGPWDFRWYMSQLSGRWSFPIGLHGLAKNAKPELPEDAERALEATRDYYENNEKGGGGYFPVGPMERYRLYHGGVHLHGDTGDRVFAPMPGQIVAARNAPPKSEIGSTNFVLMRHERKIGDADLRFYSLYMHLDYLDPSNKKLVLPKWMSSKDWDESETSTVALNSPEPVQAGDVIGFMGEAGPERRPTLHFEIFTDQRGYGGIKKLDTEKKWTLVLGNTDRRFCSQKAILDPIEANSEKKRKDGLIEQDELEWFFTESPDRDQFRWMVTYHNSEWAEKPDWTQTLLESDEFKKKVWGLKKDEIEDLVANQILPTLWWTEALEKKLGLPSNGIAFTYHPITFLTWLAQKAEGGKKDSGIQLASSEDLASTHKNSALDDREDTNGESMLRVGDDKVRVGQDYTLEDMVDGYGDDE